MERRTFGMNLKALRIEQGLSQAAVAKRVKVTQAYIAMMENGTFQNPTLDVLRRLAKALKVSVGELVG